MHTGATVVIYALVAAASPLVLTATFIVIRSTRPRTNGIAFLVGFALGTVIASGLGLVVGEATVSRVESHEAVEQSVALLLGLALMSFGARSRRGTTTRDGDGGRAKAVLARLGRVGPATAFSTAPACSASAGPSAWFSRLLAMAAVTGAGLRDADELDPRRPVCRRVEPCSCGLPWASCSSPESGRPRSSVAARSWLSTHAVSLRVWLSLGLGAVITVHALVRLLT